MRKISIFGRKENESLIKAVYRELGYETDSKNPLRRLVMIPKAVSRAENRWGQICNYYNFATERKVKVQNPEKLHFTMADDKVSNEFYIYKCWATDHFICKRFWEKYPYPKSSLDVDVTNEFAEVPREILEVLFGHYVEMKKFWDAKDENGFNDYAFKNLADSHPDFKDKCFAFEWDSFEDNYNDLKKLLDNYQRFYINNWD